MIPRNPFRLLKKGYPTFFDIMMWVEEKGLAVSDLFPQSWCWLRTRHQLSHLVVVRDYASQLTGRLPRARHACNCGRNVIVW